VERKIVADRVLQGKRQAKFIFYVALHYGSPSTACYIASNCKL
jgi:hypothetical protein